MPASVLWTVVLYTGFCPCKIAGVVGGYFQSNLRIRPISWSKLKIV
jgi:hypothetical protein